MIIPLCPNGHLPTLGAKYNSRKNSPKTPAKHPTNTVYFAGRRAEKISEQKITGRGLQNNDFDSNNYLFDFLRSMKF